MAGEQTKLQLAGLVIPPDLQNKFDWALPQDWVDSVIRETGSNPVPHMVWMYDDAGGLFGRPYPLTREGETIIEQANMAMGTSFPERA